MTELGDRLRDRFFALGPDAGEALGQQLIAEVDALDSVSPTARLHGLSLSHFPSARFKQVRFVDAAELDPEVRSRFARPCAELPELAAAFVDPEEFSFRTFENIVGLDRMFVGLDADSIRFKKPERLAKDVVRVRFELSDTLRARLEQLDELGLHVRPSGAIRGGTRFIFHAAELADRLTDALRKALRKGAPSSMLAGFVHVNPVFRCNRFEPGDAPFAAHVDSPYYHRARHHVSKYTLLLYLTPGYGEEVLRFEGGPVIREIEAMTAFVFAQSFVHEGRPYADGRKLFLRSELIFEDRELEHAPGVAELFAKACYLSGESLFAPELALATQQAFDRAAAAHWRGPANLPSAESFVHKQFRDAHFVTNGYDFWFREGALSLIECAAITLLDLLNAVVAGAPFRQLCTSERLVGSGEDPSWIAELLAGFEAPPEPVFARLNKPALFPEPEESRDMDFPSSPDFAPMPDDWDATRNVRVRDAYARAQRYASKRIFAAPILMLGKEVFLDPDRFVVEADKIHVLSTASLGPVHFAGAVFYDPEDFVGVDVEIDALQPLAPPMTYRVSGGLIHLTCDLFRNSWMVGRRRETVPVPRVLVDDYVSPDRAPWQNASGRIRAESEAEWEAESEADDES
ncbi:hypothetical protein ACNOYE_17535 [Nannocystaceae bacterium ST9]